MRVGYGVSLVSLNFDACSASDTLEWNGKQDAEDFC